MTQAWQCDLCKKTGVVSFDEHAGVYEVKNLIMDDHLRVSRDEQCPGGIWDIRVVAGDFPLGRAINQPAKGKADG